MPVPRRASIALLAVLAVVGAAWWSAMALIDDSDAVAPAEGETAGEAGVAPGERSRRATERNTGPRVRARTPSATPEPPPSPAVTLWADATAQAAVGHPLEALEVVAAARKATGKDADPVWKDAARVATLLQWEDAAVDAFAAAAPKGERKVLLPWLKRLDAAVLDPARRKRLDAIRRAMAEAGKFDVAAVVDAAQAEGRLSLERHLARFGTPAGGAAPKPAAAAGDGAVKPPALAAALDGELAVLRARNAARAATRGAAQAAAAAAGTDATTPPTTPADPLATDEAALREQRRIEQLEKLRQRAAEGFLEPIAAGLAWLALHQADDGEISDRTVAARCEALSHKPPCTKDNGGKNRLSGTALSVLALVDFRDQDVAGLFEPTLAQGVQWLRRQMRDDGSFGGTQGYEAAIGLMALGQAAAATHEPGLVADVTRGLAFQASKQGLDGGFRYGWKSPEGDLSVTGWFVQAYEAARNAGATLPWTYAPALERFVRSMWMGGARFRYTGRSEEHGGLSSVGVLSLLVVNPDSVADQREGWAAALAASARRTDLYAVYYDVRVELALRGELTEARRVVLLDLPRGMQQTALPAAGMFASARVDGASGKDPTAVWRGLGTVDGGGRVVATAFSVLTLEHALYRR